MDETDQIVCVVAGFLDPKKLTELGIKLHPGQAVTIEVVPTGAITGTISSSLSWKELH